MRIDEFDYLLPEELIAQTPLKNRTESRLMVVDKTNKTIDHKHFGDILDYLGENDVLVLNDTKVIPSRIYGNKEDTNALIEVLLLKEEESDIWTSLTRPAKRVKLGTIINFNNGALRAECIEIGEDGMRKFKMHYEGIFLEILEQIGLMPLPPYIHEKLDDQSRYQTVYAKDYGSAAAPTAGLHFTQELLTTLKEKNVSTYVLITEYFVSSSTLQRLRKNESISLHTVDSLCKILQCDITDIVEITIDEEE